MRIYIQTNQLLGCFCSELLKSGRNVFNLAELIGMCDEIDKNLREIDSTLEVSKDIIIDIINRYKKHIFYNNGLLYLLSEKPEHYIDLFSTTLPLMYRNIICNTIRSELLLRKFKPFESMFYN